MRKIIFLGLALVIVLLITGCTMPKKTTGIGIEAAKAKVEQFIKDGGGNATVKEVTEEGDLYKVVINANSQDMITYVSKDGTKFFPQAIDFAEAQKKLEESKQKEEAKNKEVVKTDVPEVELFVMSYCPYGTQIEKGILPVLDTLGSKIKFSLKFVDYAMHGEKEINENLRQYCIQKEALLKLNNYLECFLKKGEGTENDCMNSTGINASQISSCISATDARFEIKKKFADKNSWNGDQFPPFDIYKTDNEKYGVQGSPVLVINGSEVSAGRDSAGLLRTICNGFSNPPEECSKELSSTPPSAGFGEGAGSDSGGGCAN